MAEKSSKSVFERLKSEGYRLTQVRRGLVEFILNQKGHWTIQELSERAKKKLEPLGQATLYRTVSLLHREEALTETRMGGGPARYEVTSPHHHDHLTCLDCGKIFEFENEQIENLQKKVALRLGFKLKDHRMELFGSCQRKECERKVTDCQ